MSTIIVKFKDKVFFWVILIGTIIIFEILKTTITIHLF